jgi:5-methylcytosine-specific restriction endonuclease McrA
MTRIDPPGGPQPKPRKRSKNVRSRNDSVWRQVCLDRRGRYCRAQDGRCAGPLEVDHVWPRSQGGLSVVENGLPLCREHHRLKTIGRLRIWRRWLDADQLAWLAETGWVVWNDAGCPEGRGWRHFA